MEVSIPSNFSIFGPIVIGILLSVFGCGVLLLQAVVYFDDYPQDGIGRKSLIGLVLALNIAQTLSDSSRLLKICVFHAGDLIYFIDVHSRPEDILSPILSIIISTITQIFLAHRCLLFNSITQAPTKRSGRGYKFRQSVLVVLLISGIGMSFGSGLGTGIELTRLPSYLYASRAIDTKGVFPTLTTIWLISSSVTDILLSTIIVLELRSAVKHSEGGNKMIGALVRMSFQSGIIVTALQIASLIAYFGTETSWSSFPPIFISKVYSITLLASLTLPRAALRPRSDPNSHSQQPGGANGRGATPLSVPRVLNSWITRGLDDVNGEYDLHQSRSMNKLSPSSGEYSLTPVGPTIALPTRSSRKGKNGDAASSRDILRDDESGLESERECEGEGSIDIAFHEREERRTSRTRRGRTSFSHPLRRDAGGDADGDLSEEKTVGVLDMV